LRSQFGALGGAIAGTSRSYRAWSQPPRTGMNGGVHAAGACAPPFRADRDRPRPAGYPLLTDRITLGDREVPGEHATTRRSGRATWIARVTVVTAPERLFGSRPWENKPGL
jgi:hypothetical protein